MAWINVTQKLPDDRTQVIRVNTDLVERVAPLGNGAVVVFQSGAQIELTENVNAWELKRIMSSNQEGDS